MEDLIFNAFILFDDRVPHAISPLPPAPVGQPTPNFAYGSAHTKVASVPPLQTTVRQQALPQSPDDFTPRLPLRPANSIHPSLRTNPTSPTTAGSQLLAPPVSMAVPATDNISSSSSAPSTLVAMQEESEQPPLPEQDHFNMIIQRSTQPSPVRAPKSLQMLKLASSPPPISESVQMAGDSPRVPCVPDSFPPQ